MRVAVMASGRGSNFEALLRASRAPSGAAQIELLVSDRADAAALATAKREGVPTAVVDAGTRRGAWAPDAAHALLEILDERRIEAVCLAGFLRIVPPEVVRRFRNRMLNVHPSLLPAFPGLRAQRQALRAGVKISGCTVHLVDDGVDTGPILLQAGVPVEPDDSEESLSARILEQEHRIYPEALRALAEGRIRIDGRRAHLEREGVER